MNQKEYELIAGALRERLDNLNALYIATKNETVGVRYFEVRDEVVPTLVDVFATNYPKTFDKTKFMETCGL